MTVERTLSIIKPDAVARNVIGRIYSRFEDRGLRIVGARMLHLTRSQAEEFYAIHRNRAFYAELIDYMTSGPVVVQVLEGESAIAHNREIMAQPTRVKPPPAPSAPSLRKASRATRYTAPMPPKPPPAKSPSFSARTACARALNAPPLVRGM